MIEITSLDSRGRVLISAKLRRMYGLKPNMRVVLIPTEEGILIKPLKDPLKRLSEILEGIEWGRETRKRAEKWLLQQKQS